MMAEKMGYEQEIPASGFTVRIERIIKILKENNINIKSKDRIDLYFVQLGDEAKEIVLPLSLEARAK
jgi:histidyl-tRNA synthetase